MGDMTLLPQPARRAILTVVLAVAFSLIAASPTAVATDSPSARDSAQALLKASSHSGGLCVILEPSDARFAIELCRGGKGLLHVLCSEQVKAADVTALADSEGLSGLVSAEDLSPRGLPYVGGTVNLLVAEDVAGLRKKGLAMDELFRVVSPGGSVCVRQAEGDLKDLEAALARRGIKEMPRVSPEGPWRVFRKPRPAEMDDWTHWNHAADGNLVSQDRLVRTPQSLQWIAGPAWSEDPPSAGALNAAPQFMLSANGRNFYLLGQGDKASLIARDAFNGVLLWIEPAPRAYKGMVLAWGDEVVLYRDGQIVALPAATGTPARTLVKTKYCIGLLCSDGTLLSIESDRLRAVELATGRELWSATNQRSALGSLVDAGKFFCLKDGQLECLGLGDGRSAWRTSMDTPPLQKSRLLLAREGLVLARTDGPDENVYRAFDASDGKARWSHSIAKSADKAYEAYNDNAYFASGLVWV